METEKQTNATNFKRNKQMIFNEEDKLYHETNNTCHICSKTCINKVRVVMKLVNIEYQHVE